MWWCVPAGIEGLLASILGWRYGVERVRACLPVTNLKGLVTRSSSSDIVCTLLGCLNPAGVGLCDEG